MLEKFPFEEERKEDSFNKKDFPRGKEYEEPEGKKGLRNICRLTCERRWPRGGKKGRKRSIHGRERKLRSPMKLKFFRGNKGLDEGKANGSRGGGDLSNPSDA